MLRRTPFLLVLALLLLSGRPALAKPVSPELMAKLATYAESFEAEQKRASYHIDGRIDVFDSDDKLSETKEVAGDMQANGGLVPRFNVTRYVEDGVDKTAEAVKKADESRKKRAKQRAAGKHIDIKIPIDAREQERYDFDETERSADGGRVLLRFSPKERADDEVEGTAWVDVEKGTVLTASFRPCQTSFFIRYIHFSIEFGADTPLGPAVSKVSVDGEGGIWFFRKHFRGTATFTGYTLSP
jgi:hypothetical protein